MPNPARARGRKVNAGQALALLLAFVLVAAVGGVLSAGLILPGAAVANGITNMTTDAFDELPTELDEAALPQKSTILAADGTVIATFYDQDRVVVPLTDIAQSLQDAVVATEDKRFFEHAGIDPAGMLRAAVRNQLGDAKEGASTLTQQYVKNVLIEAALNKPTEAERQKALLDARDDEGSDGYARKLREAKLAISLEKKYSKDEILERYLNIAQFGVSVYGVEAAAQRYFSKPAKDLTYLESATIAGITRSPSAWDPTRNPKESQDRRDTVLKLMNQQGYISDAEYTKGIETPLDKTLKVKEPNIGCMSAASSIRGSGYFCDYVTKVIRNNKAFGKTQEARLARLYRGGLTIKTTLIPKEQRAADKQVKAGIPVKDKSGLGSSIVVVEPGTGKITAMAQNRTYNNTSDHGSRETAVNWNTDNAYGGGNGFAPGSTFKPFTLLEWLREGHSLNEQIDARPLSYPLSDFNAPCTNLAGGEYKFGNAEGGSRSYMSVLDATKNSVNSGYIAMATQLNLCNIIDGATALGVHQSGAAGGPFKVLPANVIGSDSVAPLTMAAAFATFASGGIYCEPIAISSVTDADGKKLKVPDADCHREIEKKYANALNFALSHVWDGTAKSVRPAPTYTSAGKTGTTSRNENTWFVGYTPLRASAVWVGYPNAFKPVQGVTVDGQYIPYMYGASIAAPTWKRTMDAIMKGKDDPGFDKADTDEVYGKPIYVPSVIGRSQGDAEAILRQAGFKVRVDSTPVASDKPAGTVAEQNPSGSAPKNSYITLKLSDGSQVKPPENENGDNGDQGDGGPDDGGPGNGNGGGKGGGNGRGNG
ncbi:penicillin-binding protein [Cellulomonas rhizosphaerae]|uniref:Penicillin-binding protein n=1 Tax=Cellulomonas rhizosphaerae TaxID=2293719 RepID=A0A413RNC7_9CELL|nr:transglycosylase domain-containing protein [Cellulomonas rhizosphaerae]RHA43096.1 penicillin-binding protein [Cellulomonas rhizosphaerae]